MKVGLTSAIGTMGFHFSAYETIAGYLFSAKITAILEAMRDAGLIKFDSTSETTTVYTEGVTHYKVSTPNAKVGKGVWATLKLVDNADLFA